MRLLVCTFSMMLAILAIAFTGGCSFAGDSIGGDVAHGQVIAKAHCAACHGADGNGTVPIYPRLAGQSAGYLYQQLSAYRDGTRHSKVMAATVNALSDRNMRDVAAFFAEQARGSDAPGPPALMAQGRQLFQFGSPDGSVPACSACHASGAGVMGHMRGGMGMGGRSMMGTRGHRAPTLYGQHAAYVVSRLQAYADGTSPATIMGPVAATMTAQQEQAVADYVAAHP